MKWGHFSAAIVVIAIIVLSERRKMKNYPKKDKMVFFILLATAGILSLFDLPNLPGPVTLLEYIFKPFGRFMET
ncbi:hypothetical protein LS684_09910 [Cytobacillus spongiae]|jgi:hypothetical protein|uniref:hypothetical protein n=1 Tax=Cytobacillus spongiae TaxID=2901381 RepID=UPI001F447EC6|nr:hypothetical protein [Cytobacillus spongiae]UII57704.1 hypothetical protein LS684_09910 [Cytobacillus spongiae]